jgi:ELWxxDGT repeat protein
VAATADLNGDNITDLVVTNNGIGSDPGSVSVLLGNGDGTFQPARNMNVGFRPWGVAVGDFNGDGIPDLAVTHASTILPSQNTVTILLGNGDGTFRPAGDYQVGEDPFSIAVADFRNNGTLDLVTADQGGGSFTGSVSVLLGNGDGTFQNAVSLPGLPQTFQPNSVAVGDLRGDGTCDIVTAGNGNDVLVFLGNGDGTFQPPVRYATGPLRFARWVALGDFNGDGVPDLVTANLLLSNNFEYQASVSVFLGNGDGTFADAVTYPLVDASSARDFRNDVSVVVGDFSGNNQEDLIVSARANGSSADGLYQLVGNGDGTFQDPVQMRSVIQPKVAATGDFNGDGLLDLAVASEFNPPPQGRSVSVLLNNTGHGAPRTARKGSLPSTSAVSRARAAALTAIFAGAHPEMASRLVVDQLPTMAAVDAAFSGQHPLTVTPVREQPLVGDTGIVVDRNKPNRTELWRSDGTESGTFLVDDINPGPAGSGSVTRMANVDGRLFFAAFEPVHGNEL